MRVGGRDRSPLLQKDRGTQTRKSTGETSEVSGNGSTISSVSPTLILQLLKITDDMTPEQLAQFKLYIIPIIATLFGATAHTLEGLKKYGWKGWIDLISEIIICSFMGFTFYHLSLLVYPEYSVISCSIGAYWGTKGFTFLKESFITTLQSNLDKFNSTKKDE